MYADSYFKKYSEGESDLEQMATNICMMIAHCFQEDNSGLLENIITYDKVKDTPTSMSRMEKRYYVIRRIVDVRPVISGKHPEYQNS